MVEDIGSINQDSAEPIATDEVPNTTAKPQSILEETKEAIAELKKDKEEISKIRDELKQFRSDQLLAGTGGGGIPRKTEEEVKDEKANNMASEIVNAFKKR